VPSAAGAGPTLSLALAGAVLCSALVAGARAQPPRVEVRTSDVTLFYRVYEAAGGTPGAAALQKGYLDAGSDGVRQFIPNRIRSAQALAETIAAHRDVYDNARGCAAILPAVRARLATVFSRLAQIDQQARFPSVIILIGRNNSGGTTGPSGVLIGLEVACRSHWLQPDLTDRLVHLIAHEYGHVQQFPHGGEDTHPDTVLKQSLVEGVAELIAELTSGEASESYINQWAKGRARQIDQAFLADLDSTDLKPWLYNGVGTEEKPGDLGYWVGYRIAKAYYVRASDKSAALQTLLELQDPKKILADSAWKPGDPG
jgi:Predicted Zn-dependent protease (DUF2268)